MRIYRKLSALGAFFVIAAVVAGCGGSSIPGNSVASVAGNPITTKAYNHWMYILATEEASQEEGEPVIVPTSPPDFASCISQIRTQVPTLASSSDATLRSDCKQVFAEFNGEVMAFLIEAYWYQADAHKLGITYTNAQLTKAFDAAKKSEFPTTADFDTYLKESGETEKDILFQIRVSQIYSKLLARKTTKVTSAAIAKYYDSHLSTYGTKATRDVHLVRTTTKAKAQTVYNALASGQSWDTVAKQYAADASSKTNGGLLKGVTSGEEEKAVSNAIFAAKANKLVGPVKGLFGYYVLEVTSIKPATQESLAKATPAIKTALTDKYEQAADDAVTKESKDNWGSRTLCRSEYSISDCAGYVAPKTTTTATTTPATSTSTLTQTTTAATTTTTSSTTTASTTTS